MKTPEVVMRRMPLASAPNRELATRPAPQVAAVGVPQVHAFCAGSDSHLLLVEGSRVFQVDADTAAQFERAIAEHDAIAVDGLIDELGLNVAARLDEVPTASFPVHALSLAIAQTCNLGCSYCYAQEGDFGGAAKNMDLATAEAAVDRLLADLEPGDRATLAFMGGEPLANRRVLRAATSRAARLAARRGIDLGFSITTNGTLVTAEDGDFFERHGFAVTVSLDGIGDVHDRLRPFKNGRGSFERIMARIEPLLGRQRAMQVSARVTVTASNLGLVEILEGLVERGFHSVGFSPMLSAPSGRGEMDAGHLEAMLQGMMACGDRFEQAVVAGRRLPFANMVSAMQELHQGTHRPYPCGAGAGYLAVSADGELAACHRFVGDPAGALGSLDAGIDSAARQRWLSSRHVHRQSPCSSCWARYLCGGACHHEVIHRGRVACDYIRAWLDYCLQVYVRLLDRRPDYFSAAVG